VFRSALTAERVAEYEAKLAEIEQKLTVEAEIDSDPAQSRQRNAANGWKFHSRKEEIDIFTRRDGEANFCKGKVLVVSTFHRFFCVQNYVFKSSFPMPISC
jgi:plasmid rolling circle replication initiator protein Rep